MSLAKAGIKWIGLKRWQRENGQNGRRFNKKLKEQGKRVGTLVAKDAKSFFGGRLSGPDRKRTAGGTTLGSYSGKLKRAISAKATSRRGNLRVEIGPTGRAGVYGMVHELGIAPYPARPFLSKAVESSAELVFRELGVALKVIR